MIFRILYSLIILSLVGVILFTEGYFRGHDDGYKVAMANTILGIDSPDAFFMRMLESMRKRK